MIRLKYISDFVERNKWEMLSFFVTYATSYPLPLSVQRGLKSKIQNAYYRDYIRGCMGTFRLGGWTQFGKLFVQSIF